MKIRSGALVLAAALAAGCHKRVITTHDRDEAANEVSEAEFAVTIKDFARAEALYAQAAKLCPDQGETWASLGICRVELHNSDGARQAYKAAVSAFEDDFDADHSHSASAIRAATVLVVLGRVDEARSYLEKAAPKATDRRIRDFIDSGELDRIMADPTLKRIEP